MRLRYIKSTIIGLICTFLLMSCNNNQTHFNIKDFGAKGDGKTLNTQQIQNAIDKAYHNGGGTVIIPAGIFMSGTIFLKSNVTLNVNANATLLGSPNIDDYYKASNGHNIDRQPYHLILAENQENITIKGTGTIDGNSENFWQEYEKDSAGNMVIPQWIKPKDKKVSPLIEIVNCKNINIEGIGVVTGGGWNIHLHDCEIAKINKVNIINNLYSPNSDGIDITGSSDIIVSDCYIKTCDDAIVLKTTPDSKECRRVTVTNCVIETLCVGLKLGATESYKDITDVTFNNCIVNNSSRAVGLYVREGAHYENIIISNIISNTNAPLIFNRPIHIMVEKRTPESKLGSIKNVIISNFICNTEGRIMITAEKGSLIENIIMRDIILSYPLIENPEPLVEDKVSAQFPKPINHPEAVKAKAAIVAENVTNLVLDNIIVNWPGDTVPLAWQHPVRIENGKDKTHRFDYSNPRQTEFNLVWGRNLNGGYINAPLANSSSTKIPKFDIKNSTIKF